MKNVYGHPIFTTLASMLIKIKTISDILKIEDSLKNVYIQREMLLNINKFELDL